MPIPEQPLTRKEMYLNSAAGGSGTIPETPLTREEQYLDAIAKNGGGSSSGGVLVVHDIYDEQTGTETLDKTLQEIYDAMSGGTVVFVSTQDGDEMFMDFVYDVSLSGLQVNVHFFGSGATGYFNAESASGYPVKS